MKKLLLAVAALGVALTVGLPGAFARVEAPKAPQADPGINSRSITIGGTFPFSGRPRHGDVLPLRERSARS